MWFAQGYNSALRHNFPHRVRDCGARNIRRGKSICRGRKARCKLVEGWDTVPIFGKPVRRRARAVTFNGLSAHADREDLLAYVRAITPLPSNILVVHGEERQAYSLAAAIRAEHSNVAVTVPELGKTYEV